MAGFKESKVYSILNFKCPRCHEGNLFPPGTMLSPSRFSEMYAACPCCGQPYELEPGFYYGSMYVSFGLSTGIFLGVLLGLSLLVETITFPMVLFSVLFIVFGLLPLNFRLSRAIWINIFVRYEGPCAQIRKK